MNTAVTEFAFAPSAQVLAHFEAALHLETDCADLHISMNPGPADFVVLDVRSPALYESGHVPGAINLPQGKIIASKMKQYADQTRFVVYCAGPHCNGAHRAAARLARLGCPVKIMIGGITGWLDEGFALSKGSQP